MAPFWPLVGRRDELALLGEALEGDQGSHGVVLAGPAGVGKTRMAQEAIDMARSRGPLTEWAVATKSAAAIPLAALAHLVPSASGPRSGVDLMQAMVEALLDRAKGRRIILGVDDAHLLDDASATFVHHVAMTGAAMLLLTVRAGEVAPDPIVALWKERMVRRVDVQPLGKAEVAALLGVVLGQFLDGPSMEWLWATSGGNLLYLRELVSEGMDSGQLQIERGIWTWRGELAPGPRLTELLAARLGRLDRRERGVLELLALGEPLKVGLLERRCAAGTLVSLEQRNLVAVDRSVGEPRARLGHPLYGDVVRAEVGVLRAEEIYRWLADTAEAGGIGSRTDVLAVAAWRLASGGGGDPEVYLAAAQHAHAIVDPALVERLARAGLAAGGPHFETSLVLGEALAWQGALFEADNVLAPLVPQAASDRDRASLALARAVPLFWGRGRAYEAEAVLGQAVATIEDLDLRHELMAFRAAVCLIAGRSPDAAKAAIEVAESPSASPINTLRTLMALLPALALCGRLDRALAEVPRILPAIEGGGDVVPEGRGRLLSALVLVHQVAGNLEEAADMAHGVYDETISRRARFMTPIAAMMLGTTAVATGQLGQAIPWLREAAAGFRERDPNGFLSWSLANLAQALGGIGQSVEAVATMTEADAALGPAASMFAPDVARARAWVAAAGGELSRARSLAQEAAEAAGLAGQRAVELVALHDALRLGAQIDIADRIDQTGAFVEGRLAAVYLLHARALHDNNGPGLDNVSQAFHDLGAQLLAAEAATEAAERHAQAGLSARQTASTARAVGLLQLCDCRPTTPVLARLGDIEVLTRREREVADLAARGAANREIADLLTVSVRTVEGHLARAFAKLGISGREELHPALVLDYGLRHRSRHPSQTHPVDDEPKSSRHQASASQRSKS